ncbi:aminotransferase class V-fold PLP-dependent enzyme [Roseisolibacter sp. H3M3-2]|uniref:pyridoxal phosphate-dependent decarboxylase family protein n=1 Tax=Roseisolibacter sp. H3M3-2 TaxID=3031323 RepID=UPI0023DC93A2|nr:aminotransferase class V-fold PLP-dependent enzyme [Roseisolibacter sp. H3M3-2]MDF1502412.1 aminotransferase class V-fold PLP-dependent enzyme [Roseisolibacter sp. H3M3-2]
MSTRTEVAPPAAALTPDGAGPREAPLRMSAEEFRRLGHQLVDAAAAFLSGVPDGPVTRDESPAELRALLGGDAALPADGADAAALLAETARLLFGHSLLNGHPRFFGYITSSPAPIGMLGDLLAAVVNPNVGSWRLGPIATEIEAQTVRWIAELLGYPADGGGLLVSGGNMANMVGLFAARAAAADWDVRAAGVAAPGARRLRVYASAEAHTWLQKATDLAGLGTDAVRWLPTDDQLRLDVGALRAAVAADRAAGDLPMLAVGSAGTVATGAVDPLPEIAQVCREEGLWFHVDGAYGAFAAAAPDAPPALAGLALADSVAVDPHKWLYAPLEAGCVLVRDPARLRDAFAYHPPYYHFGQEATNYVDYGPQNSRGFRALKVWLALRQVGRNGYARMIGDDVALSRRLHARVAAHPDLEPGTQSLSITTFRYVPADLRAGVGTPEGEAYLDALNRALLERLQTAGEAFVSNAVVRGRYLLRACIVNFHTAPADVDALPDIVARTGRDVRAALDAAGGRGGP